MPCVCSSRFSSPCPAIRPSLLQFGLKSFMILKTNGRVSHDFLTPESTKFITSYVRFVVTETLIVFQKRTLFPSPRFCCLTHSTGSAELWPVSLNGYVIDLNMSTVLEFKTGACAYIILFVSFSRRQIVVSCQPSRFSASCSFRCLCSATCSRAGRCGWACTPTSSSCSSWSPSPSATDISELYSWCMVPGVYILLFTLILILYWLLVFFMNCCSFLQTRERRSAGDGWIHDVLLPRAWSRPRLGPVAVAHVFHFSRLKLPKQKRNCAQLLAFHVTIFSFGF